MQIRNERVLMCPEVGEYYYFADFYIAAGVIKRSNGEKFILRGMSFSGGLCVSENIWTYTFEEVVGNTKYTFVSWKYGSHPSYTTTKPRLQS
jgi:hypothetical protein